MKKNNRNLYHELLSFLICLITIVSMSQKAMIWIFCNFAESIKNFGRISDFMAKNLSASRQIFLITLIVCLLSAVFLPRLYSQNDISHNSNPVVEMRFVPSCTPTTDASSAQTGAVPVKGFYIAKHKVTRRLWNEVMGTHTDGEADDYLPVTNVSRDEVQLFIFWLNQKTNMQYRLPTESEWTCAIQTGSFLT